MATPKHDEYASVHLRMPRGELLQLPCTEQFFDLRTGTYVWHRGTVAVIDGFGLSNDRTNGEIYHLRYSTTTTAYWKKLAERHQPWKNRQQMFRPRRILDLEEHVLQHDGVTDTE